MIKINRYFQNLIVLGLILRSMVVFSNSSSPPVMIAQPTSCIHSYFSASGNQYWKTVTLTLINKCSTGVDLEYTTITFKNKSPITTNFWGEFGSLPYPEAPLNITSQPQSDGNYLASLNMHFIAYPGSNTVLPVGKSIKIKYGTNSDTHIKKSVNVYLKGAPVESGVLQLKNVATKPSKLSQDYALIRLSINGNSVSNVQVPWQKTVSIPDLVPGTYMVSPQTIDVAEGRYEGSAKPSSIEVSANKRATSTITYNFVRQTGEITINAKLPAALLGYEFAPSVLLKDNKSGGTIEQVVGWDKSTIVNQLRINGDYTFSTDIIKYGSFQCAPEFTPAHVVVKAASTATTLLTYKCVEAAQDNVNIEITGAPYALTVMELTFTPNDNSTPLKTTVYINNGKGTQTITLTDGAIYKISSPSIEGYSFKFSPQPLTATPNANVLITLTKNTSTTPVAINGQLHVCGTKLCNQYDKPIQLKGISSHGIQWFSQCLTPSALDTLVNGFKANVMRIALYVQEDGYKTNPSKFTQQVSMLIDQLTARGMYVIVDWHILTPGDPNYNLDLAKKFFTDIATKYKNNNNIIYEIANEPNGVTWKSIVDYANQVIPLIREIDANAPILVGTRGWSSLGLSAGSNYHEIVNNPLQFSNIMYSFHFYAASHGDKYLNALDEASDQLPVFVTEFGTPTYSGDGPLDLFMSDKYINLMSTKKIGWANWNYSDAPASSSIWIVGTCAHNIWTDNRLTPSGVYIKSKILND